MNETYSCGLNLILGELDIKVELNGDPEYIEEFLTDRALNQIAGKLGQPTWESLKKKILKE